MIAQTRTVSAISFFLTVLTLNIGFAQESSISAPANDSTPVNTTTTSTSELKPEKSSPWKGGILFVLDRNGRVRSAAEDQTSTNFQTETHFRLKYQATEKDSFSLVQRLYYFQAAPDSTPTVPFLGSLRAEHTRTGQLAGGDASFTTRVTLPTTIEARRDWHFLGMLSLIPEVYWTVTPKWSLGYSGFMATEFYDDTAQMQGAAATAVTFINSGVATYSVSDKVSISQTVGIQEYNVNSRRDLNHPERLSQTVELGTMVSMNASKNVSLSVGALQSAPTMEGSINSGNGKVLAYEKDFSLFSRDQTTYEVSGSVNF